MLKRNKMKKVKKYIVTGLLAVMVIVFTNMLPYIVHAAEIPNNMETENSREEYQKYTGEFTSSDEEKVYKIDIDFTNIDTAVIGIVRNGKSNVVMTIYDSQENQLVTMSAYEKEGRRWYFIDKPFNDSTVESYTVHVTTDKYVSDSSKYTLFTGDKKNLEYMISGEENAVWLDLYREKDNNSFFTGFTPNKYESWYRFLADGDVTCTILTYYANVRFEIKEVDTKKSIYNTKNVAATHKTKFCLSYGHAEKAQINTEVGKEYYLIVYPLEQISPLPFVDKTMCITVGKPNMMSGSVTKYSSSKLAARSSGFNSSVSIDFTSDDIPNTAVAVTVYIKSGTSSVKPSNIQYWRVQRPNNSIWYTSGRFRTSIDMGYVEDANTNKKIKGIWRISAQASSSTFSFIPGLYVTYYYELGD